ncbi:hypothetical protein LO762_00350 [Actinocorallia sp. API 0066]|uniref:hypothetical protein n=1 Tax=Actinocorallia sp. API 0066 TaxID=2896846 RepID=UPI001E5CA815|nr:hypothetical protein [Actinocorallia sp. API 0066]MCD0447653.1 hypothetical protein [Actinocorallia sp. API 0066]
MIAPFVGELSSVSDPAARGFSSDVAAVVEGDRGRFFIKGMRGGKRRRASLLREAAINPYAREFSPAVRWQAESDGWLVLGFEVLEDFRPSDLSPGSEDLPEVVSDINANNILLGQTEHWAKDCTAWRNANPRAIDAFATASIRQTARFAEHHPDKTWLKECLTTTEAWAEYRSLR